ncbi:uncharacterized protein LOC144539455 [Centroberyx gerrardi]
MKPHQLRLWYSQPQRCLQEGPQQRPHNWCSAIMRPTVRLATAALTPAPATKTLLPDRPAVISLSSCSPHTPSLIPFAATPSIRPPPLTVKDAFKNLSALTAFDTVRLKFSGMRIRLCSVGSAKPD